jgi:hypothetical protein
MATGIRHPIYTSLTDVTWLSWMKWLRSGRTLENRTVGSECDLEYRS